MPEHSVDMIPNHPKVIQTSISGSERPKSKAGQESHSTTTAGSWAKICSVFWRRFVSLKILGQHSPFERYPGWGNRFQYLWSRRWFGRDSSEFFISRFQAGILRAIVSLYGTAQPSCMVSRDSTKMNDKVNLKN
jgi:hypothetical protein